MQYTFKEYKGNYKNYEFPYLIYLKANEKDSVDEIYQKGFLPTRIEKNLYYLSRNIRINLKDFSFNSENRRVLKKTPGLKLKEHKLNQFVFNYNISKLATEYFKEKFGENIISTQKLKNICENGFFTNILTFELDNAEVGYCITMQTKNLLHYSYPFYKKELIGTNIGMGMILKTIEYALKEKKQFVYLGTVYSKEAKYKLQFKNLEWFSGVSWCNDIDKLKEKINGNE